VVLRSKDSFAFIQNIAAHNLPTEYQLDHAIRREKQRISENVQRE
jgi:hypothetical protein